MQREILYHQRRQERPAERRKVVFGIIGGVLYLVLAIAVMQVAFLVWSGTWQ
jgi:hypothetical protein